MGEINRITRDVFYVRAIYRDAVKLRHGVIGTRCEYWIRKNPAGMTEELVSLLLVPGDYRAELKASLMQTASDQKRPVHVIYSTTSQKFKHLVDCRFLEQQEVA